MPKHTTPHKKRPARARKKPRKWQLPKWLRPLSTRRKHWWRPLLRMAFVIGLWGLLGFFLCCLYWLHDLPDVNRLTTAPQGARKVTILAENGSVLSVHGDLRLPPLTFSQLPAHLISAVVATEDRRFFEHGGIDVKGILRAGVVNMVAGRVVQGGSSITQQLAKIAFLTPERSFKRKIQELVLAFTIEHQYSKEAILAMYLNRAYMGAGIYGVGAAAHYYFDKPIRNLSLYEAAIIAGLLKAPSRYSPIVNLTQAEGRAKQILRNMEDAGLMTATERAHAEQESPKLNTKNFGQRRTLYFSDYVIEQAESLVPDTEQNLVIHTTCDSALQERLQTILHDFVQKNAERYAVHQGALVLMTPNGAIHAMIGGTDYMRFPYNRAVKSLRQPGSSFKPIIYAAALEAGVKPTDYYPDAPIQIGKWQPRNMSRAYRGEVTVSEALMRSINTVSVRLSEQVGRENVIQLARRMGITTHIPPHPSLALGAIEVKLLDLTTSYAVFDHQGLRVQPYTITAIREEANGKTLYQKPIPLSEPRILSKETSNGMIQMMQRVLSEGTGKAAYFGRPAAGKTGTTQDFRDAWFVGFTPQFVAGVWLGNDDNTPMNRVSGGSLPAILWKHIMIEAHQHLPIVPFGTSGSLWTRTPETEDAPSPNVLERFLGLFY